MNNETIKWEGVATALSSVTHGEQQLGTGNFMRREKFLLPDGTVEEIPLVSGNALRGSMRDYSAKKFWHFLGKPHMNISVSHALFSGGTISKSTNSEPLSGLKLRELREACPVISIFGAAGGGRIMDGILSVGKMIPITSETKHLIPEHLLPANIPGYWDILQLEEYSRFSPENIDTSLNMRYGIESFISGTQFYTWFSLDFPSEQDLSFFGEIIDALSNAEIPVGGQKNKGFGKVKFDFSHTGFTVSKPWHESLLEKLSVEEINEIMHRMK